MRESTARGPAIDLSEFERRLRGPEPSAAAPKTDPLSELARLMQGGPVAAAADPYSRILSPEAAPARQPAPDWSAPAPAYQRAPQQASASRDDFFAADLRGSLAVEAPAAEPASGPYYDYEAAQHTPAAHHPAHDDLGFDTAAYQDQHYQDQAYQAGGHVEHAYQPHEPYPAASPADYHAGAASGGWPDESRAYLDYGQPADEMDEDMGEPSDRPGFMSRLKFKPWHAVAGIAVIGLASIGWGFAHRGGAGRQEIATIAAPAGPVKVAPAAEAEQGSAGQGAAILDRKESAPVNKVVSHEEQAVDPKVAPRAVALGSGPVDAPHEPAALAPLEPRKVKTVSVRPDGSVINNDQVPSAITDSPSAAASTRGDTPKSAAKPATTPRPAQAKAKDKPKVAAVQENAADNADDAAETPAAAKAVSSGAFAVQFGAAGSEPEARSLMAKIAGKYGSQLGGHRPTFKMAKVDGKTVYRVRVGGVSKDSAVAICEKVKAGGGNCFIAGN
jgi:hypothetical protein